MARRTTSKSLLTDDVTAARSRPRKPSDPAQPRLLLDPMPARVEPCLALLKSKPPKGPDWSYEIKWDGWRGAIHIEPSGVVRVLTKNGHDWSKRFPAVVDEAKRLGVASAILDGEIVCFDELGRSDFNLLQQSLGGARGSSPVAEAAFIAFDLVDSGGRLSWVDC